MKKILEGRGWKITIFAFLAAILFIGDPILSRATTATIAVRSAKVRREPNTSSDAVAGVPQGSTITILEEVKDSAGKVWYKVTVDNQTGYIRSDLVNKSAASGTSTPIEATKAYVNYKSVRVRSAASTSAESRGSIVQNTAVTIVGEAKASDGKKWYEIEYTNTSGNQDKGFVRADLITIGEAPGASQTQTSQETQPEQPAEESQEANNEGQTIDSTDTEQPETPPASEEVVKPDYEMVFTENSSGVKEWYLYDNINGTRQTLAGLLEAASAGTQATEVEDESFSKQMILIFALAALLVVAVIIITLLCFKNKDLRDELYGGYEDNEDEEEEETEEIEEEDEEEIPTPAPAKRTKKEASQRAETISPELGKTPAKNTVHNAVEGRGKEGNLSKSTDKPEQSSKKKAKNFLLEDDDFEFEFLNMDD